MSGLGCTPGNWESEWDSSLVADSGELPLAVEISVALAGFSAIVVLFRRGESGTWLPRDADRFHGMILHAAAAT